MQEWPLTASTVVAIVLRLFAIYWLVTGATAFISSIGSYSAFDTRFPLMAVLMILIAPGFFLLLGLVSWIYARGIAGKITGSTDPVVPVTAISRADLYGFGLLITGLWYFLSHLGGAIGGLHQLALYRGVDPALLQGAGSPIQVVLTSLVPCVAGLVVAIRAPSLGRKIAEKNSGTGAPGL